MEIFFKKVSVNFIIWIVSKMSKTLSRKLQDLWNPFDSSMIHANQLKIKLNNYKNTKLKFLDIEFEIYNSCIYFPLNIYGISFSFSVFENFILENHFFCIYKVPKLSSIKVKKEIYLNEIQLETLEQILKGQTSNLSKLKVCISYQNQYNENQDVQLTNEVSLTI